MAGRNMDIHHGLSGNRRVDVERADHSRVVAERGGRGYVQHPYMFHGREFGHRTYFEHGRAYDRFYSRYGYRGAFLDVYAPAYYFAPAFYGWAYNPWIAPVPYAWGWAAAPWYGYYGFYFAPEPVYPSASFWLADYLVATSLAASYQAQVDAGMALAAAGAPPVGATQLTPDVKQEIALEVQRQIALENSEARSSAQNVDIDPGSSGIQRMLTDGQPHFFVAGRQLDVVDGSGAECALSEGDALQLAGAGAPNGSTVTLTVLSTKGGVECRAGAQVSVGLADLQDMQNHMREVIDQGMGELRSKQGQGGLPALPAPAAAAPVKAAFAAAAPPPDPNAGAEIGQQSQAADQAEKDASGPSAVMAPLPTPQGPPPTVGLGMTVDEVTGAIGQPVQMFNAGAKKIYVYKDIKVTFTDGKVSSFQ